MCSGDERGVVLPYTTPSALRLQPTALSMAFSSGSPRRPESEYTRAWAEARTWMVGRGHLRTGTIFSANSPLKDELVKISIS